MNLFLTEEGVLKLGTYGLTTQAECYSIKEDDCDGVRSFAPEVIEGEFEMKSDVWSLGTALLEMMDMTPYSWRESGCLPTRRGYSELPFDESAIESEELADFLKKCFKVDKRWSVNELMDVSVMG